MIRGPPCGRGFRELQAELAAAEKALADAAERMPHREPPASVEAEIAKAMALTDRIETICADPSARAELNRLIQDLGIRIGLTFRGAGGTTAPSACLRAASLPSAIGRCPARTATAATAPWPAACRNRRATGI
ncbi:MAG: hypothetical protein ACKOEM_14560, partial [Planctomycetia bacterium]